MPKPARIIKWRIRRQQRRQRSGVNVFRWLSVIVLGLATAVFTFILLGAVGVTAVFASFSRDLPVNANTQPNWSVLSDKLEPVSGFRKFPALAGT